MYLDKKIIKDYLVPSTIFLIFFVIGIECYQDYGISIDENYHRESGKLYYLFLKGIFLSSDLIQKVSIEDIKIAADSDAAFMMPVIFDVITEFFADILNLKDTQEIFFLRHLFNFIFFLIGCYFFYLIILKIFNKQIYAYLGLLFLFFYPRIFGESFYNNKDIIFLSSSIFLIFFSLKFLEKQSFFTAFTFGIFSALAFDIRVMASLLIFAVYFMFLLKILDNKNFISKNYKYLITSVLTTIFFIFVFWPYLWIDPINNLLNFFHVIKVGTPAIHNYYLGEYYYSKNVPWHFDIVWVLITIPLSVTIFFIIGFSKTLLNGLNVFLTSDSKNHKFWNSKQEMYNYFFLLVFLIVLFAQIKFAVSYDAWRHLYFLYPIIVLFFLNGIFYIVSNLKNKKLINFLYILVLTEMLFLIHWNFKNHPHQYVFFNPFFKSFTSGKFELDYWGLSNRSSLEFIANHSKKDKNKVATISFTSLENSLLILDVKTRNKILIVRDLNQADFVIDNYRKKWDKVDGSEFLNTNFEKIFDLSIDDRIINTVYKKRE